MTTPIPLDEARRRLRVPRKEKPPEPPGPPQDGNLLGEACPVTALGHLDGTFVFVDVSGQVRRLTSRQLGSRSELMSLFLGDDIWLRAQFPRMVTTKTQAAGETVEQSTIVGFVTASAADFLMLMAREAGIYSNARTPVRLPGIWTDNAGRLVVHAGDALIIDGTAQSAGRVIGGAIWTAAASMPRPNEPCDASVGRALQAGLQELWTFRDLGSAILLTGFIAVSYFGAAVSWRPSAFLTGETGWGKTFLLNVLRATSPMHYYTNDASLAGVQSAVNGRAMPIFIDESSDRDEAAAQTLLNMVLASSGGEGTKGVRGTADGGFRTIEVVGTVMMASTSPPQMQPQHLGRFAIIELRPPRPGTDYRREQEDLASWMRGKAAGLWGRALSSLDRWKSVLTVFRDALNAAGCAPREMDQLGALLAGWWVLTRDGDITSAEAKVEIVAIKEFVRDRAAAAEDAGPRQCAQFFCAALVQYDGTTRREQVGTLLRRALGINTISGEIDHGAVDALARHGVRTIRGIDVKDSQGRDLPRRSPGDGVWILPVAVRALFVGSRWEGDRWHYALARLESASKSVGTVRIGGATGKALWIAYKDLAPDGPDTG